MNTPDADTRRIGRRLGLLATLAFLALGWVSFDGAIERREDPNRNLVVAPGASELVLQRNRAGHYLLPPQQAAWIPVGLRHQATMNPDVKTISVMFHPTLVPAAGDRARIVAVSPLIREMMIYALRWSIERAEGDEESDGFFTALANLVSEALDHEAPLNLPTSEDPVVAAAMAYTKEHLDAVTAEEVSRVVAVSPRTLRRQFQASIGWSWRTYLLHARMLRAMALLAGPGQSVQETARAVGFDSISSFTRAFGGFCNETPSGYRRRVVPQNR